MKRETWAIFNEYELEHQSKDWVTSNKAMTPTVIEQFSLIQVCTQIIKGSVTEQQKKHRMQNEIWALHNEYV